MDVSDNSARYKFSSTEQPSHASSVNSTNWTECLNKCTAPEFDVWIIPKEGSTAHVSTTSPTGGDDITLREDRNLSPSQDSGSRTATPQATAASLTASPAAESVHSRPWLLDFVPFLQWPTDDENSLTEVAQFRRADVWLNKLEPLLQQLYPETIRRLKSGPSSAPLTPGNLTDLEQISCRTRIQVETLFGSLDRILVHSEPRTAGSITPALAGGSSTERFRMLAEFEEDAERFFLINKRMLSFFVSDKYLSQSGVSSEKQTAERMIGLYWSLVERIILVGYCLNPYSVTKCLQMIGSGQMSMDLLKDMIDIMSGLLCQVEDLHRGARRYDVIASHEARDFECRHAESAVLQIVLVRALVNSYLILFKVMESVRKPESRARIGDIWEAATEMSNFLDKGRDYLVAEAEEVIRDQSLGPTMTRESIVIILFDRLSRGVYRNGSMDVVAIYEQVLEKLVERQS